MNVDANNQAESCQTSADVLTKLKATRVRRTKEPSVYELSWNLITWLKGVWHGASGESDKQYVVATLVRRYPNVFVLIGDWTSNPEARRLLGVSIEPEKGKKESVLVADRSRLLALLPHLDEGGWAMIFLDNVPDSESKPPGGGVPKPLSEFKEFVHTYGGCAAISSWFDDISWLVLVD